MKDYTKIINNVNKQRQKIAKEIYREMPKQIRPKHKTTDIQKFRALLEMIEWIDSIVFDPEGKYNIFNDDISFDYFYNNSRYTDFDGSKICLKSIGHRHGLTEYETLKTAEFAFRHCIDQI